MFMISFRFYNRFEGDRHWSARLSLVGDHKLLLDRIVLEDSDLRRLDRLAVERFFFIVNRMNRVGSIPHFVNRVDSRVLDMLE